MAARGNPPTDAVVGELLDRHGRTYASQAGIRLERTSRYLAKAVWKEYDPFVDASTLTIAEELGLPRTAQGLRKKVQDPDELTRLVAALVRTRLGHDHERVLAGAGER